ncbi:MAG: hypothetical protein JXA09_12445 [Anaerolineae bacterium]|nr:hypothetical protein [Anaerolineae bacterium]
METLLGIDLGTTGIKAAVCSPGGDVLGEAYLEYPLIKPSPGVVEQDADLWWALTREAIRRALREGGVDGSTVRALGVSSQGISFVPVDAHGRTLDKAISWLDTRAIAETEAIRQRYSDAALFGITGKRAAPSYVLPKLLWLRAHRLDLVAATSKYLMGHDYIVLKLCGQSATDHSMAGGTMLYDLARGDWSPELLAAFGIDRAQLPEVRWSGTPLGTLIPAVAAELGLGEDTVVVVGGQDQKCAALGAHIRPGVATVSLGTASAISCLTERPVLDAQRRIPTFPFVVPGYWDLEGVVGTAGGALRWLRDTLFPGSAYDELNGWAAASEPGANGVRFYPHLSGAGSPHWRADVWGAWTGLSLSAGAGDLVRSVLEGVAFQIRYNLDVMRDMGLQVDELVLFGGGAQSPLWARILSDVADMPLTVSGMVDVANWGACLLAGIGAGLFEGGFAGLPQDRKREGDRMQPQPAAVARYREIYCAYRAQEAKLLA